MKRKSEANGVSATAENGSKRDLLPLEIALLGLLSESPRHAYELDEVIRQRRMREWVDLGFSTLYQALHRMAARGLVESRPEKGVRGPEKRVFTLTQAGKAGLAASVLSDLSSPDDPVYRTQLAGMFAPLLSIEEQVQSLRSYQAAALARVAEFKTRWEEARKYWKSDWQDAIFRHGILHGEAEVRWAEEMLGKIQAGREFTPAASVMPAAAEPKRWPGSEADWKKWGGKS